jgi:rhodanese-related sulfurtransferase
MKFHPIFIIISFGSFPVQRTTSKAKQSDAKALAKKSLLPKSTNSGCPNTRRIFRRSDKAVNVNWLETILLPMPKNGQNLPCVLQSGGRSQSAAEKLEELGFTNIYQLQGGILKWDAAGLSKPITKSHVNPQEYNKLFNLIKVH